MSTLSGCTHDTHGSPEGMPCAYPACPAGTPEFEWCIVTGEDKNTLSVWSRAVWHQDTYVWVLTGHREIVPVVRRPRFVFSVEAFR